MTVIADLPWRPGEGPHDPSQPDRPLMPVLRDFVLRDPGALAATEPGRALDRAGLWRSAMGHAAAAAAAPGPVGLVLPAGIDHAAALLGCLAAGRLSMTIDPTLPPDRRAALAQAAGIVAAFGPPEALPRGCAALVATAGEALAEAPPGAPAMVSATSGSSGAPKLVVHARRALAFQAWGNIALMQATAQDRLVFLGGHATVACAMHLLTALLAGGAWLVHDAHRVGPSALPELMRAHGASLVRAVPTLARALPRLPQAEAALARVRALRLVGEALPAADVQALRAVLPADARIIASFSATETIPFDQEVPAALPADGPLPSGRLRAGGAFVILDEAGRPCARHEAGEILVRSRYNAIGEWQDGRCVPGRMLPDPSDPEGRIYRTGDVGLVGEDGVLRVLGRIDRQVKVNGNRVEPAEVEAALLGLGGVRDAAVVACSRRGRTELVAFAATALPPDALRGALAAQLPAHAVPARVVALQALPLLPGGKPDLQALRRMAEEV